ncbi:hypothetical protein GCM10028803_00100 [Larkinella knui]|uniref:Uncharacterized protein n=1 Tax=Larkinella knui TaxID=2025310 RepID=A0A3P1CJL1_9BACT|nr:hypothetical protein [Larkinella knui]RRB13418.1 hypothetical protein EHT87_14170 [Larkinella knui]
MAEATVSELNKLIGGIVALLGIKITDEDVAAHEDTVITVIGWIKRRYATWTLDEIRLAYELAVDRKLDVEPFRAIDPNYFSDVMAAFGRFRANDDALQRVYRNQLLISDRPEPTPEQINAFMESELQNAINQVWAGEEYPDLGNGLYDWLDKKGRIPFTPAQKWAYVEQAEPLVRAKIAAEVATAPDQWSQRNLKALLNASIQNNTDLASRVRSYAKYLALNDYLKTL